MRVHGLLILLTGIIQSTVIRQSAMLRRRSVMMVLQAAYMPQGMRRIKRRKRHILNGLQMEPEYGWDRKWCI